MSLEADCRYDGVIIDAGLTQIGKDPKAGDPDNRKPAIFFKIKTEDGIIEKLEWCTPAAVKYTAEKMAKCFGCTREQLANMEYLGNLGEILRGSEVSITTKNEEKKPGEWEVVVEYMNPRGFARMAPTPATKSRVAQLFGGASPGPMPGRSSVPDDGPPPFSPIDDDVPF